MAVVIDSINRNKGAGVWSCGVVKGVLPTDAAQPARAPTNPPPPPAHGPFTHPPTPLALPLPPDVTLPPVTWPVSHF